MALDPRSKMAARCAAPPGSPSRMQQQSEGATSKDFFSAIKKVGDLEILNDVGFGGVAEGLRNLASVSDTVRTTGTVPSALLNEANDTNNILSAVGIDSNAVNQVANFHPEVANRALGQAKSIARRVSQGGFQLNDIPGAFADLQNLKTLAESILVTDSGTGVRRRNELIEKCDPSPYAQDLISYYPKYKFLFVVEFQYTEPFAPLSSLNHAFVVKNTTRPNIEFEYDEVNMYNFWTRVVKRTIFQPMTMRFYDDNWNQAMQFYNSYLQSMSPITNLDFQQRVEGAGELEESGMDFSKLSTGATPKQGGKEGAATTHRYAASIGPLASSSTTKTILSRINLYHVFREGARMNVYQFINPKITNLELDDLDMAENGDGGEVSLQFAYDTVNILTNVDVINSTEFRIEDLSSGSVPGAQVLYPLSPIAPEGADTSRKDFNIAVSENEFGPGNSPVAAADVTSPQVQSEVTTTTTTTASGVTTTETTESITGGDVTIRRSTPITGDAAELQAAESAVRSGERDLANSARYAATSEQAAGSAAAYTIRADEALMAGNPEEAARLTETAANYQSKSDRSASFSNAARNIGNEKIATNSPKVETLQQVTGTRKSTAVVDRTTGQVKSDPPVRLIEVTGVGLREVNAQGFIIPGSPIRPVTNTDTFGDGSDDDFGG